MFADEIIIKAAIRSKQRPGIAEDFKTQSVIRKKLERIEATHESTNFSYCLVSVAEARGERKRAISAETNYNLLMFVHNKNANNLRAKHNENGFHLALRLLAPESMCWINARPNESLEAMATNFSSARCSWHSMNEALACCFIRAT